jgi:hypothetical protein
VVAGASKTEEKVKVKSTCSFSTGIFERINCPVIGVEVLEGADVIGPLSSSAVGEGITFDDGEEVQADKTNIISKSMQILLSKYLNMPKV